MKGDQHPGTLRIKGTHGFSLIEVMVVLVIAGILATGVVFMFANPSAKVKSEAFNMLGEFNLARSEAVSRNADTYITFLPGAIDGYRIWTDDWKAAAPAGPGSDGLYTPGSDTLIRETFFPEKVQFYDKNATGGPNVKPIFAEGALDVEDGIGDDDDGVDFNGAANEFAFTSRGIANLASTGYAYIYYPDSPSDHSTMRAAPYAMVVHASTGRIRISRWTEAGSWKTK